MSPLSLKGLPSAVMMVIGISLSGCSTPQATPRPTFQAPDYIGLHCEASELSRIVKSNELYSVCLDSQWVMVSSDQFSVYKGLLDRPIKRAPLEMEYPRFSDTAAAACVTVTEYEVGWVDVDYKGEILRMPLVDGSCSLTPCSGLQKPYQPSVCQ